MAATRRERILATGLNQAWTMGFASDALFGGKHLRALTLVDEFQKCLANHFDGSTVCASGTWPRWMPWCRGNN